MTIKHWFVSSHNVSPQDRSPTHPWALAARDTDTIGVPNVPFWRNVKYEVQPDDRLWVWDAKQERRLVGVYRTLQRHSDLDGDGYVRHPFYDEPGKPAVVWDVELLFQIDAPVRRQQIYDAWKRETNNVKYKLFTNGGTFNQSVYCYGPLGSGMVAEFLDMSKADSDAFELIRGGGVITEKVVEPAFDPTNIADARKAIMVSIKVRRGQKQFRERLVEVYGRKCCMTDCCAIEVLKAAHIVPYRGRETNHVSNGLLLRADVHTLFDLGLVGIDPKTFKIFVSSLLQSRVYRELSGKQVLLPADLMNRPQQEFLEHHKRCWQE